VWEIPLEIGGFLLLNRCVKIPLTATMTFTPSWKKHEEKIFKGTPQEQSEATEKFLAERKHAIETDPQAKNWEEGRKKQVAKEKNTFVKEKRASETKEVDKMRKDMRVFGISNNDLLPAPGYLLVSPEVEEIKTASGLYIPTDTNANMTNRGYVVEVGRSGITNDGRVVEKPCEKGDFVLFKKGAGVEIKIKDKDCRFMQFSDILGVFVK